MAETLKLRRVLSLARPELRPLTVATVALLVSAAITLAYPQVVRILVDGVLADGDSAVLNQAIAGLVVLFAIRGVFTYLRSYLFTVAGERIVARLRRDLYRSLVRQEIAFFDDRRTGELTNRLASDTTVLQNAVSVNVSMGLRHVVMGLGALGLLVLTSWKLTVVMLAIVPVVVLGARYYGRYIRKLSKRFQDALAAATEVAEETLSGIRTVRAFAQEEAEVGRYGAEVEQSFEVARSRAQAVALFQGGAGFAGYAGLALVLWYGGQLLGGGELSVGELSQFLLYTMTLAFSIGAASGLYEDFMKALGASERVFELLDRPPQVRSGDRQLAELEGEVALDALDFAYPARADVPVFSGLSLTLHPGEVVALVGPSGAGKSTVAQLISRFYDPQAGAMSLDGVPYVELDADWLREQVGVVRQEPVLFATSILDNIRYGRPDASRAEVEAAAQAANAHDFVSAFPQGYDTRVGERGVRLSGGQRQRVAIARALLKDPRILILDEATSSLDAESEHLVQEALERLMQGRTTLVIAHRLSTVKGADRVLVLDGGRVVQEGTHAELVVAEGLYRRLVERQFAAA